MGETCFVGCTPGLEEALGVELQALGVRATVTTGGCEVTGQAQSFVRLNVRSRLASRVLLRLGHARTPAALASVPVRAFVGNEAATLSVTTAGRVTPPAELWRREAERCWRLNATGPSAAPDGPRAQPSSAESARSHTRGRVHDGGAERPQREPDEGRRGVGFAPRPAGLHDTPREASTAQTRGPPGLAGSEDEAPAMAAAPLEVSLRLDAQGALVSIDTSGELLHVRGARQETGRAPLRETLASGVLKLCGWAPGEPLWDVMCGSGTFLLEAAEQALGLQPGRNRHFAFERFESVSADVVSQARAPGPAVATWLRGSDLNAGALGVARRNARRAGVLDALQLERLDATALRRPEVGPGLVLANLPYGKRVGARFELATLYSQVGRALRASLAGWRFAFLVQDGADALGLEVARSYRVKNGGLSCLVVTGRL
ncbi:MAG: RNA methyltransferase [Myxococcaceae bacterium]|nr:RNA methyltransferase [Myxococcaceae bacterium]